MCTRCAALFWGCRLYPLSIHAAQVCPFSTACHIPPECDRQSATCDVVAKKQIWNPKLTSGRCLPHNEPIDLVNVAFQRNPDLPVDNNKFQKDKGKNKDKDRKPTKGAGPGAKTRSRGDRYPGLATAPPPSDVGSELGGSRGAVGSAEVPVPVAAMGALDLTGASTSPISTPNAEQDAPSAAPTQGQGTKSNKQKEGEKLPNGLTEAEHARILAEHEYNVPDRIAGYEAVDELRRCCEGREFRFVTVDVTYAVCCRFLAGIGDSTEGDGVQRDGVE